MNKRLTIFTFFAIVFISLVLRPPIAAVGPLLHEIAEALSLDVAQQSLLTAIPVFCFGLGAFISPYLVRKLGFEKAMLSVLVTLLFALLARVWFGFEILFIGTVMVGLAIAVANVLLPTLVRSDFANRAPLLTSIYTTLLALSASLMAGFAVVLSQSLGGWPWVLALTAVPAALAIALWLPRLQASSALVPAAISAKAQAKVVARSSIAWSILGYFSIQSLSFYFVLGWLPTILIDSNIEASKAGAFLGLATAIGIPSGLAFAPFIARLRSFSWLASAASLLTAAGFAMLASMIVLNVVNNDSLLVVSCALIAIGQSANFPISLSLIATRAASENQTTSLSAFSQGWGYLIAGLGTFLLGAIGSASGNWSSVVFIVSALTIVQVAVGFYAGRDQRIAEK